MRSFYFPYCLLLVVAVVVLSCRTEVVVNNGEQEEVGYRVNGNLSGFYLLNEGSMGSNKATLDFYDFATAIYHRNIYVQRNPNVPKELGDVGNDLKIYGSRLYAVINCSNKIEVMDAQTCKRIGQIDIPNCRYLRFSGQYGYITSYAGPVQITPQYSQVGYVARFDTATLELKAQCLVGFQPDELEIVGDKMYVANSGGYMVPNYENTISVIDLGSFTELKRIPVAVNLHHLRADNHGQLWVSSRGDYYGNASRLYCIDTATDEVVDSLQVGVSDFWLDDDRLYVYSNEWSYLDMSDAMTYAIVDVVKHEVLTRNFITDGTEKDIQKPYGLCVNPINKDIYITDAKMYVTPGTLFCYSADGVLQWKVRTGDIPAHFSFLGK